MATAFDELGAAKWTATWGPGTQDHLVYVHDFENGRDLAPMTDYRNSIVGYWDETSGVMVELADYNPEGRLTLYDANENVICDERGGGTTVCPTAAGLPFGFNGQWRSETTGFVYMRNRWYSPRLAQFITHDPLEYIDSYNPFTFASLDPINFWDPWGLSASNQDLASGAGGFGGMRPESRAQFSDWLPGPLSKDPADMLASTQKNPCQFVNCGPRNPGPDDDIMGRINPVERAAIAAYLLFAATDLERDRFRTYDQKQIYGDLVREDETWGCGWVCKLELFLAMFEGVLEVVELGKLISEGGKLFKVLFKPCSFVEGTPVLMCDGTYKNIEEVEEGDWVLSQDPKTGELGCKEVEDPYSNQDRAIILLELRQPDGSVEVIETTDNHPFFVTDRGWTRVDSLLIGDEVPASDGRFLQVVGLTWTDRIETVYNFGVDGFHTYFVGESGAWVHNCYKPKGAMVGKRVGHTFSKHGRHNTKELTLNAKNSGQPQGQWLDEEAAEQLIADNLNNLKNGAVEVSLPSGVGRVIMPDGSFKPATRARLVPSGSGVKTAYPILE